MDTDSATLNLNPSQGLGRRATIRVKQVNLIPAGLTPRGGQIRARQVGAGCSRLPKIVAHPWGDQIRARQVGAGCSRLPKTLAHPRGGQIRARQVGTGCSRLPKILAHLSRPC